MKDQNRKNRKNFKKAPRGGEAVAAVPDKFSHIEAIQAEPLQVKVYGNNFDKALRAFRALINVEGRLTNPSVSNWNSVAKVNAATRNMPRIRNRRKPNAMIPTNAQGVVLRNNWN